MKAEYLFDVHEPRDWIEDERLIERDGNRYWPAGTIEEHPKAYMLVRMGTAKPADDECVLAAGMSSREQAAAQRSNEAVRHGIHPDDYQLFFDEKIKGYNEDGSYIKGPNWDESLEDDTEEDDE